MSSPGCYFTQGDLVDRVLVMRRQEDTSYAYNFYLPPSVGTESLLNNTWREKICQWAYNVVDQ